MTDHLKQREESRSEGTPEGVPSLALLALAGHAGAAPQSPPPNEVEPEVPTVQSEADEAEKGNEDRLLPLTPDFAKFLRQIPEDEKTGQVFKINALYTGKPMTPKRVGRVISTIGKRAGVVVDKAKGKYAGAHDLRRAFGTRWASKVKPATLQLLMRHKFIETTLKHYVAQDADEVADELWRQHADINTSINTCKSEPKNEARASAY